MQELLETLNYKNDFEELILKCNFLLQEGLMQTHDEETRKFFKHSSVICVLSPRYPSGKLSYVKQKVLM